MTQKVTSLYEEGLKAGKRWGFYRALIFMLALAVVQVGLAHAFGYYGTYTVEAAEEESAGKTAKK